MVGINKSLKYLIIVCICLLHFSCGLTKDSPDEKAHTLGLNSIESSCSSKGLRPDLILEQDISEDINCLEQGIYQYIQIVRRKENSYILLSSLQKFINKFFPKQSKKTNQVLKLTLQVNSLLFNDKKDRVSISNIPLIFEILRLINSKGKLIYQLSTTINPTNYPSVKNRLNTLISEGLNRLQKILVKRSASNKTFDIIEFINTYNEITHQNKIKLKSISHFLSLKKLFLGGNKNFVTNNELSNLLGKINDLTFSILDIIYINQSSYDIKIKQLNYLNQIKNISKNIADQGEREVIFYHEDIINLIDLFTNLNTKNIERSLYILKEKMIGGNAEEYRLIDIKKIILLMKDLSEQLYFNTITFEYLQSEMDSSGQIYTLNQRPPLLLYQYISKHKIYKYWKDFKKYIYEYRFYPAQNKIQQYDDDYHRSKYGLEQITFIRWVLKHSLEVWGHSYFSDEFMLSKYELTDIIMDNEGILKELNLWRDDTDKFVSELITSIDLFQYNSDGDGVLDAVEISEYINTALSGQQFTNIVHSKVLTHCPVINIETQSVPIKCFRKNIFNIIFSELKHQKYFKKLYQYTFFNSDEEIKKFLLNVEQASRLDSHDKQLMNKVGLTRMLVTLSNIENIFIRYDLNKNNKLDYSELNLSYTRFSDTILTLAKTENNKLGKSIFWYFIKYMKIPTKLKLVLFHAVTPKRKIVSRRLNLSSIMLYFTRNSKQLLR